MIYQPRIPWLKESLSRFYLDFVEKLPIFQGSTIATLQEIRRDQRKQAAKAQQVSKPPAGAELGYGQMLLMELFPIEDYERMERDLRSLLPPDSFRGDYLADFRTTAFGLSNSGNTTVGYLLKKPNSFHPFTHRVLATLPDDVKLISVRLHKILPSAFVVTFTVLLEDRVGEQLRVLQSRSYLPRLVFRYWIPWGRKAISHSRWAAETARQDAIGARLVEIRESIEAALKPFVSGYFAGMSHGSSLNLPSVPVLTLKGVPTDQQHFREWLGRASGWLSDYGASHFEIGMHGFKSAEFLLLVRPSVKCDTSARLCFAIEGNGDTEDLLDSALPFLIFSEFLDRTQATIEGLRKRVYERLSDRSRFGRLRANFELNRELQRQSMLLARFETEIEQSESALKHPSQSLNELKSITSDFRPDQQLGNALFEDVKAHIKFIKPHIVLASDLFSNHLTWMNLDANYRLQFRILIWTVVVSIATILSLVLPNWNVIKQFLERMVHWL